MCEYPELHLARWRNGIYFALIDDADCLRVWILQESCGQTDWMLNHVSGEGLVLQSLECQQRVNGPWTLDNANCADPDDNEALVEQQFEWNSDDDSITHVEDIGTKGRHGYLQILGFHPYKEIILNISVRRGLAYHSSTSKLEDLGNLCPKDYRYITGPHGFIKDAFSFTPCWLASGFTEDLYEDWQTSD